MVPIKRNNFGRGVWSLAAGIVLPGAAATANDALNYRTVAYTGITPPNSPTLEFLQFPSLNAAGQIGFTGGRSGTPSGNGFWFETNGTLAKGHFTGDPLPGAGAGVTISSTNVESFINAAGQEVAEVVLSGSGVTSANDRAFVVGTSGNLQTVVRTGNPAPGVPDAGGAAYLNLGTLRGNGSGTLVFDARLTGGTVVAASDSGVWAGQAGGVQLVAREGNQAPGASAGVVFNHFGQGSVTSFINDAGQIAFRADLTGSGVTSSNNVAIFSGAPGSLQMRVRAGDSAPASLGAGLTLANVNAPSGIDSAGRVTFTGVLFGPGVTVNNSAAAFVTETSGDVRPVARRGNPVPNNASLTYQNFTDVFSSGTGGVAMFGTVAGAGVTTSNNEALFRETPAGMTLVLREGDQAPTLAPGVLFGPTSAPQLNGIGSMLFSSTLTGAGVTGANDGSLWLMDAAGELTLIVREGDTFHVNGFERIVSTFSFMQSGRGLESGRGRAIDDTDNVTFEVRFTDTSEAAFVVAVPEPGSLAILAAGTAAVALGRRRRGC